jgi:hypothetical protein
VTILVRRITMLVTCRSIVIAYLVAMLAMQAEHCTPAHAGPSQILVEAEQFADLGGWDVDQQAMEQMGSPYLLAHGLGVPVKDATTGVTFPSGCVPAIGSPPGGSAGLPGGFRCSSMACRLP